MLYTSNSEEGADRFAQAVYDVVNKCPLPSLNDVEYQLGVKYATTWQEMWWDLFQDADGGDGKFSVAIV